MSRRLPRLDDLVIILPGITGSVLQKNGVDVWGVSRQSIWGAIRSAGHVLGDLTLDHTRDDPQVNDIGDGITADRLIDSVSLLPGVIGLDGYTEISQMIQRSFKVVPGRVGDPTPANLYSFPYDWRRDNRGSARQLQAFIDERLPVWREFVGRDDPGVVLLAHSMGGLVSRYYLEVLGGAETAKLLMTFGTPFRGSPQSLHALSHGIKKGWLDLSPLLRSFTSIYQLLPIYPAVVIDGQPQRVAETAGIPGLDQDRALDALAFHREIESANAHNDTSAYLTLPYVGFRQPTIEHAALVGDTIESYRTPPSWIDSRLGGGDGTVPRVSAIPIEMSDDLRESYIAEQHGALQTNGKVLDDVHQRLLSLASTGLGDIRGEGPVADIDAEPAVGIAVDDLFEAGEPVVISAEVHNVEHQPVATVTGIAAGQAQAIDLELADSTWTGTATGLAPGLYRAEVRAGAIATHRVFEVLP